MFPFSLSYFRWQSSGNGLRHVVSTACGHAEALEHFKVADELMPDSEVIQKNLVLTRLLMTGRSR